MCKDLCFEAPIKLSRMEEGACFCTDTRYYTTIYILATVSIAHAVAQLVEALRYESEDRGFDSRRCYWKFYLHNSSDHTMALGSTQPLTGMSNRNIFWGKRSRCVGLTTLQPSCADSLEICEP
jgi:hypothetical protein